jgi:hypothetical protein
MTAKKATHRSKNKGLFKYKVPNRVYKEYYKKLNKPEPFYIIVPSDGGFPELMFLPSKKNKKEVVSFVFFRRIDALKYLEEMTKFNLIAEGAAMVWNCSAKTLFYIIEEQVTKHYENNEKSVTVITSSRLGGEFRDIEVFWTSNHLKTQ